MIEGLIHILEKELIVSTVNANDLIQEPQKVDADYLHHAYTFVPLGDTTSYQKRLIEKTIGAKTPKGVLVAPVGYGKTSTLVFLWHECEKHGLLAIPPFFCSSLLDILKATYGWTRYRLKQRAPDALHDLEDIYHRYASAGVEEKARHYAEEHGISPRIAADILNDQLAHGELVLSLTPSNLLFFLDQTADLVTSYGYKGLAVFPDEFQQYISKGTSLRRIIQEFREFVWGLDTRKKPLGMIISMLDYTEAGIRELGKDILDRIRDDGLYYNLRDIYDENFPSQLFDRYAKVFNLGEYKSKIIDEPTLKAIGQIASREDLGRGPRTVVDAFQCAVQHFDQTGGSYSPINLADDLLSGYIKMQESKLRNLARQALASQVIDTPERQQAIKLLAAFPKGCPTGVQRHYHLLETIDRLSRVPHVHGELITHLIEGYTLRGLERYEGPTNVIDEITARFWREYEEDMLHVEAAQRTFIAHVLLKLFGTRRGATTVGWSSINLTTSPTGSYLGIIEGSFSDKYPRRKVALQVAYDPRQLQPSVPGVDLQFDFLLLWGEGVDNSEEGKVELFGRGGVRFHLNTRHKTSEQLPQDLIRLQTIVNPHYVTPFLMLGLIDYFDRWESLPDGFPITESDKTEVNYLIGRYMDFSLREMFNEDLRATLVPQLQFMGDKMVEEVFLRKCGELFPDYHTFFVHPQYSEVMRAYVYALAELSLKERRGHKPVAGPKDVLARRFGVASVASFETRARNDYRDLMEIVSWERNDGKLLLKFHPLEQLILEALNASAERYERDGISAKALLLDTIGTLGREKGYRDDEIVLTLELLAARKYISLSDATRQVYLISMGPGYSALKKQADKVAADIAALPSSLLEDAERRSLNDKLASLQERLSPDLDDEAMDELRVDLARLQGDLDALVRGKRATLSEEIKALLLEIEGKSYSLAQIDLRQPIKGQLGFTQHLNEMRVRLEESQKRLSQGYGGLKMRLIALGGKTIGDEAEDVAQLYLEVENAKRSLAELGEQRKTLDGHVAGLNRWIKLLRDGDTLYQALERIPELRKQVVSLDN